MSFQGDVAGIGLGELLQGLARGARDGVLTLYGDRISSAIGMKGGQLFLIEGPDETEDMWRERTERAFADYPDPGLESNRRKEVSRAARLEVFYQMLEALNLSFRFEPGPLPAPVGLPMVEPATGVIGFDDGPATNSNPWGPGVTVEYLLLEHARIADECGDGPGATLNELDVPRVVDLSQHTGVERDFLEHCEGRSTLQEIADRVAWPLTKVRAKIGQHLQTGAVRMAEPRELLAVALHELELSRTSRAAHRLAGWIRYSPPGPPPAGDADLLVGEWERGRLGRLLYPLDPKDARALVRKLDATHTNKKSVRDRWRYLYEAHRGDERIALHETVVRLTTSDDPEARIFHDLLRLAGTFQDRGHPRRSKTLLRLAASHMPSRPKTRIELGKRMIEVGLVDDGVHWLLDTARELIAEGEGERAMVPVRAVLKVLPDQPEAMDILHNARASVARRKRRRWNTMAALSIGLTLSGVALVRYREYRNTERILSDVQSQMHEPDRALQLLSQSFPTDEVERITELRGKLEYLKREQDRVLYEEWETRLIAVQEEGEYGDPLLGLRRTLELPPPPSHSGSPAAWAGRQELFGLLANRIGNVSEELDLPINATIEDLKREERLLVLIQGMIEEIDPDRAYDDAKSFRFRLSELNNEILDRREKRAVEREKLMASEKEQEQDILLGTARSHDRAGDLERSLAAYERLIESDEALAGLPALQQEIATVRTHYNAVQRAISLCELGRHEEAREALQGVCPRPIEHMMPWRVSSRPQGARVLLPGGRVRTTPYVERSGFGEHMELVFEAEGFQSQTLEVDGPTDLTVFLHLFPERKWRSKHTVEAAPVPVGNDHVVADRAGRIARLDKSSKARWEVKLETLGGIAATPIFLPKRPGTLLVVSEDGLSWFVDASTGKVTGPRDVGSPLIEGPSLTRSGVSAKFADGRVAVWSKTLEPSFFDSSSMVNPGDASSPTRRGQATLITLERDVLRESVLRSPWTEWTVEIRDGDYFACGPDGKGFSAKRHGAWIYVAWESPNATIPHGRLWTSDESGLHAYVPDPDRLIPYRD